MGTHYNSKIPGDPKFYFDISNPKCISDPGNTTVVANTRLTDLISGTVQLQANDLSGNQTFVLDNGNYVYNQNGINGGEPCWHTSASDFTRSNSFSFVCWYKYNYGSSHQRTDNIYGGGFSGRTSFYLSPGGTSASHGILRYDNSGNNHNYSATSSSNGGNDGEWHMFAATDSHGGSGQSTVTKVYIDAVLKQQATSNTAFETASTGQIIWGAWTKTYGNFNGRANCFIYYDRVLTDAEVKDIFNATRGRFGV